MNENADDRSVVMHAGDSEQRKAPCPNCGYDLRGHPDHTVCPECGREVVVSAANAEMNRWADTRLLDLWSISVLQLIGGVCLTVSMFAVSRGQYVAVLLGLTASLYVIGAASWLVVVLASIGIRSRRVAYHALGRKRWHEVLRWSALNIALLAATSTAVILIRWL